MLNAFVEGFKMVANRWELVLGLVALIGLLMQRAGAQRTITGVAKTIVGVLVLKAGSGLLQSAYKPVMEILQKAFQLNGVIMDPYGGWMVALEGLGEYAAVAAQIMVLGFCVNLLLARVGKLKFVYLTGHTMLAFTSFVAWILRFHYELSFWPLLIVGALIAGTYWTLAPAAVYKFSAKFTGNQFTLGHMSGMAAVIGSLIGKVFHGSAPEQKESVDGKMAMVKDVEFTGVFAMFRDNIVATSLLMTVILGGACLLAGKDVVSEYSKAENWIFYSLFTGVTFSAGITVLLTGVRLMLAEIVPAFKGISDKVIPGAVPALDMPVFFTVAPTAAVLGFIFTFAGEFLGMILLLATGAKIITVPGVIPTFFDGGMMGVFAYYYGGKKATIVSGLLIGVIQMFGGSYLAEFGGFTGAVYPNTDYTTFWTAVSWIMTKVSDPYVMLPALFAFFAAVYFWLARDPIYAVYDGKGQAH